MASSRALNEKAEILSGKLKTRQIVGSYAAAKGTVDLLKQLVSSSKAKSAQELLDEVRAVGVRLQAARPIELVIGNVVRRVLHIIREEMDQTDDAAVGAFDSSPADSVPARIGGLSRALNKSTTSQRYSRSFSLHNLLDQEGFDKALTGAVDAGDDGRSRDRFFGGGNTRQEQQAVSSKQRQQEQERKEKERREKEKENEEDFAEKRQSVLEGIADLIDELKDIDASIAANAPEHIHANEVVLTFGYSRTVLKFLKRAKEKRDFQVIVAEGLPSSSGLKMAGELDKLNIKTTLIADSMAYVMMARANKVIISAHALLADGGVMASVGTSILAAAARRHNVPVVVLAGIYKLSPNFPHEPGVTFNEFGDPSEILSFSDQAIVTAERSMMEGSAATDGVGSEKPILQVHNPLFDYIPPDRISLICTDHGHGFMPSYVYRQLSEFYDKLDYSLSKQLEAAQSR